MVFSFNYPLMLLLVPVAVAFVVLTSKNIIRHAPWRRITSIILRTTVFVLLIACMAGFGIKKISGDTTSIFVYDGSDSTAKSRISMEEFIGDSIKHKKNSDKAGIVNFGADASVELTPDDKPLFTAVQTKVNSNFTDIEQGLKLASSLIPAGDRKRIILVSDGNENAGDALKQARLLKQQGITMDVYPVKAVTGGEVQVKDVTVPESLHLNEKFEIVVNIDSTVKTRAVLKLYTDRQLAAEKNIELQEGENNFAFSDTARKGGLVTYTAVIEPESDAINKNNTASTFSYIEDTAQVLVIQDKDEAASELVKMLGSDVKVTVNKPENLPVSVDELQKYDVFVISNVSAEKLDDRFLNSLEVSVRHQGKGLLVTGGENSYAPGGYFKTALEKVLPVNMEIKPKEEMPNLGLILVIDKSGSMSEGQYGISKVELAKEAAIRATEVLKKDDMIGVIGFDAAVQWVVKPQKPDDLKAIQDAIGTIRADGGTSIIPPLQEAYNALKNTNTKLKHIILLTDGQAEKNGYDQLMEDINAAGITLSTVAVGREADSELLEALSIGGSGRFYQTDVFSDIPKIFAKETFLAGKTYLNNRTFTPTLKSYSEILKDIKAIPVLDGYVGTTPKDTATVIFSSDRDDPVLATWQYGLGRTAAWTSDAKGMWTSKWLQWDQSSQFWKNLLSWLMQKRTAEEYTLKAGLSEGNGQLELILPADGKYQGEKVEAVMVSPSGKEEKAELSPSSPGTYRGSFNSDETGVYIANISIKNGDTVVKNINSGITIPYSPEYDITRKDTQGFLEKLAYEGGGRIIKSSRDTFSGELSPVVSITDMVPIFLPLIIILFLLDIAVRRLNIPIEKVRLVFENAAATGSKFADIAIQPVKAKFKAANAQLKRSPLSSVRDRSTAENSRAAEVRSTLHKIPENAAAGTGKDKGASQSGAYISTLLEKKERRKR